MRFLILICCIATWSTRSHGCNPYFHTEMFNLSKQQFIPINDGTGDFEDVGGISEDQYNEVLDRISDIYTPILEKRGLKLQIERLWEVNTVNAFARREGNVRRLLMYGGYARHRLVDVDAFIALACHEMGHHLGGTPHYTILGWEWCSAEGQADYFATLSCTRRMMANDDNEFIVTSIDVPDAVKNKCSQSHPTRNDEHICQRAAVAGYKMTQVWENGAGEFTFDKTDPLVVTATKYQHPAGQCRIDTYLSGSTCHADPVDALSDVDPTYGTCNSSTDHSEGLRPLCWYKP